MARVRRYLAQSYICFSAETARDSGADPPEECAVHVSRRQVRWLAGEPYCFRCLIRELREGVVWQMRRRDELRGRGRLTDPETAQLVELDAAYERRRLRKRESDRRYRKQFRAAERLAA